MQKEKNDNLSVFDKIKSVSSSLNNWVNNGIKKTSDENINIRTNICNVCDFWDSEAFNKSGKCNKCGCNTWFKIRMDTEKCPLGKW